MPAKPYLSKRKKAVMEAVKSASGPFTAMELWKLSNAFFPGISRSTVYRILWQLRAARVIKDVVLPHGLHVFVQTDDEVCCILECEDCGRFKMCSGPANQIASAASNADILPSQAAIYIRGRCREKLATDHCNYSESLNRANAINSSHEHRA